VLALWLAYAQLSFSWTARLLLFLPGLVSTLALMHVFSVDVWYSVEVRRILARREAQA